MGELYEVEVKLPLTNLNAMRQTILQAGGVALNSEVQVDKYYDHPCRSFAETDESVRMRHRTRTDGPSITESGHAPVELTYKGPKIDKTTQTRTEYTVSLSARDMESMIQILLNSGFKQVATVTKKREFFDIDGITVSLDDVSDVGFYIEFELIADGEDEMKVARKRILKLLPPLGLNEGDMVQVSYLELYLEKQS